MAAETDRAPRILVIRRDNIGDLVCTTPLIDALRARYPRAHLAALVNTYNAEVLARNPALDAVHAYEKVKHRAGSIPGLLWRRLQLMQRLRAERFDYALLPATSPETVRMAKGLKAGKIVGFGTARSRLDIALEVPEVETRHEVERSFAICAPLGVTGAPGKMRVYPDPIEVSRLHSLLAKDPLIAVHVSARRPAQRWPFERYEALIRALAAQARVVLLWAPGSARDSRHPGDDEAAAQLAADLKGLAVTPLATPGLGTLIAALSLADRVICPDGGAMQLAAALGKPVVALFGDSPVERWRPWGVPHRVVQPESRNLADLALEPVLEASRSLA